MKFDHLLIKHPNINRDYLLAAIPPWDVSDNEAIGLYVKYVKGLVLEDPDKDESINRLKSGLKFVFNFCKEKNLTFPEYLVYSEGALPSWVSHLKTHKIDFHTLHSLQMSKPMLDSELLDFVISRFFIDFQRTRQKFYNSKRMREFGKKAKEQLDNILC